MKIFRSLAIPAVTCLLCMEAAAAGDARLVGFWVRSTAGVPSARWTLSANGTGVYEVDFGPPYLDFVLTSKITKWSTNAANNTFTYTVDHQSALGNGPYSYDEPVSPPKTYTTSYKITGTTNKIWAIGDYTYAQAASVTEGPSIPTATLDKSYGTQGISWLDEVALAAAVLQPKDAKVVALSSKIIQGSSTPGIYRVNMDGTPDKAFNSVGNEVAHFRTGEAPAGLAVHPVNGKILVAGTSYGDAKLVCHTPAGALDTSFNTTGTVLTDVGNACVVSSVEIQPKDGKILVAGRTSDGYVLLLRYLPSGELDLTFNGTGMAELIAGAATCLKVQPADGKIVVGGMSGAQTYLVCRFNADGTVDTTFNAFGQSPGSFVFGPVRYGKQNGYPWCLSLVIRPDGRIVAGGKIYVASGWENLILTSHNPDGTLDRSFNGSGQVVLEVSTGMSEGFFGWTTYYQGTASHMVLQKDGKVVVAGGVITGTTPNLGMKTAVLRYNTNGTLDTTFNGTGKAFVDLGHGSALLMQPADERLIIPGSGGIEGKQGIARIFSRDYTPPNRKKYHTVTLGRVLAAQGTVSGGGGFPTGTKVTLKAKAKKGYKFAGWKEKGKVVSKKSPYTFTVKANRSLAAVFKKG